MLHFSEPLAHARGYTGWSADIARRVAEHLDVAACRRAGPTEEETFATSGPPRQIIILNGTRQSGKSSIAAAIQNMFEGVWMNLGWMPSRQ